MNRFHSCLIAILLSISLISSGCLEVETTTSVRSDGSLLRSAVITGDSASVFSSMIPVPLDSVWKTGVQKVGSNKFTLTATREFADVEEMNRALRGTKGKTLGVTAKVERTFRWFFTMVTYRETWLRFNPFDAVPITDYISPKELEFFVRHEMKKEPYATKGDSLALKDADKRFEKWNARNMFEVFYQVFLDGVRKLNDRSLTVVSVEAQKEKLFEKSSQPLQENKVDTLSYIFERLLRTPTVRKAFVANSEGLERFKWDQRFLEEIMKNSYRTHIVMPGLIIGTNAPALEGNKASWEDFVKIAYFEDAEMWVESQVTNWWAITITGVVVTLIVALFVLAVIRRRRTI